jgi:peptide chain release factor 1
VVFDRLAAVEDEYVLLETSLGDPELLADQAALRAATKRYKDLTPLVEALRLHRTRVADVDTSRELMNAASGDERELWRAELAQAESELARLEDEIRTLMLPKDPNDGKGVIIEIRGAEGGEECEWGAGDAASGEEPEGDALIEPVAAHGFGEEEAADEEEDGG